MKQNYSCWGSHRKLAMIAMMVFPLQQAYSQTAFTNPVISSTAGTAASYSATVVSPFSDINSGLSAGSINTYNFGTNNKRLTSFQVNGVTYQYQGSQAPTDVFIRRNPLSGDNTLYNGAITSNQPAAQWKDRQIFYSEGVQDTISSPDVFNMVASYPGTAGSASNLETAMVLLNGFANTGSDNTFVNIETNGGPNPGQIANFTANNIERVDLLWSPGISITSSNLNTSGIVIGARGNNDDALKVSAIKGLTGGSNTGQGTNYVYSDVLEFNNAWTQKGVNGGPLSGSYAPTTIIAGMPSIVFRRNDNEAAPGVINDQLTAATNPTMVNVLTPQAVNGMFITFAQLGMQVGDTFFGYSLLPADAAVQGNSQLVNSYLDGAIYPPSSPNNTQGADLSAINAFMAPNVVLTGSVFDDGNALTDNTVNGSQIQFASGEQLYANLYSDAGVFISSVPVDNLGNYGVAVNMNTNYIVAISSVAGSPGSSPSSTLPALWANTGETNNGLGTLSDGTVDGITAVSVGTSDVAGINFGIEQLPESFDQSYLIAQPSVGASLTLNGTGATGSPGPLTGSDLEDYAAPGGDLTGKTVWITSPATNGQLLYEGIPIPLTTSVANPFVITNYDPSKLTVVLTGSSYTQTQFTYAYVDNAGLSDPTPGTYTIQWQSALPVVLARFTVTKENRGVLLQWQTTSETQSSYFDIQHSVDGKQWASLARVDSKGESLSLVDYSYYHQDPAVGSNLYRLKMVDTDETYTYSQIRNLSLETVTDAAIYPNPVSDWLVIDAGQVERITLYSAAGIVVYSGKVLEGRLNVATFKSGIYSVSVTQKDGTVYAKKLMIVH